jgi:multiple sugar transport system permease protein/sorbitol/mannitol transport system permease protein
MLPATAILVLAFAGPLLFSAWYSLTGWMLTRPGSQDRFVGLANYARILRDPEYWQAVKVTLIYAGSAVTIECILGVAAALMLNRAFFGRGLFRSLMLIPMVVTPAVVGLFWKLFYDDQNGLLNYALSLVGAEPVSWLGVGTALASVILMDVWQATPFFMLIVLAGLQSIDENIVSAAEIDGATRWQLFRYITLPHLVPYIAVAAAFRIIAALADFDKIYLLTFGGPGNVTTTISLYAYNRGFKVFDIGQTTAISLTFMVLVLAVTAPLIWHLLRGSSATRH